MIERLLIVGLGSIGRRHARLARSLFPAVSITALSHAVTGTHAEPDVDHHVYNLNDALASRPQAAVIANPASEHVAMALGLARAGVHLLVEKPISHTIDGVEALLDECRSRRLILMTGYNLRFLGSLQRFRRSLNEGLVGPVLSVRAEVGHFLPCWRPETDYRRTVSAQAALGGGVLLELSHEIDYLRWLFGEVAWISATLRKQSTLEIDVEDTAHIVLGFMRTPAIAALSMDFVRHDAVRSCTIIGQNGSLRWDARAGAVEVFDRDGTDWRSLFAHREARDESYIHELRHFAQCISEGTPPLVSGEDGLAVLRIIEAARLSSQTRRSVSLVEDGSCRS